MHRPLYLLTHPLSRGGHIAGDYTALSLRNRNKKKAFRANLGGVGLWGMPVPASAWGAAARWWSITKSDYFWKRIVIISWFLFRIVPRRKIILGVSIPKLTHKVATSCGFTKLGFQIIRPPTARATYLLHASLFVSAGSSCTSILLRGTLMIPTENNFHRHAPSELNAMPPLGTVLK